VAVIGAGPVGLAAAAQLVERGLPFVVLEAGDRAGAAVLEWGHVRLFSPWEFSIDAAAGRLLEAAGWVRPDPQVLPTGAELVEQYLRPLAELPQIAPHVRFRAAVTAVSRLGVDRVRTTGRDAAPFVVRLADGVELLAGAVLDASGTWRSPNPLGVNGLPAVGEAELADRIGSALPDVLGEDRARYAGRHTLVVGAGHSAANTLLVLAELADTAPGTQVTWAIRRGSPDRAFGGGQADALPARGALGSGLRMLVELGRIQVLAGFGVTGLDRTGEGRVEVTGRLPNAWSGDTEGGLGVPRTIVVDEIVNAAGYRPDHSATSELRLDPDPVLGSTRALAPLIDPNEHSCGTVRPHGVDELTHPEPGYYAVGMKSYGRAPTFLLATGYEQARSVVAALAGDWEAARRVELHLPETGVCSTTAGARSLLADAADRYGLAPDVPAKLVSAAVRHLPDSGDDIAVAVGRAAADLGIGADVAKQLAVLAADQLTPASAVAPTRPAGGVRVPQVLPLAPAVGGGCCGA
jgi:thioredoxin reductase